MTHAVHVFQLRPYFSSRFSIRQGAKCEIRELRCNAQKWGCDIVFYDKYATLCKRRGISMSAAATEAGLSKSLVTKWKVNKVEVPSPDVLKKLSAYFGIPVSELIGEDEQKEKPTVQDDGLTEHHIKLIEIAKTLSAEDAKLLLVALQAKQSQ